MEGLTNSDVALLADRNRDGMFGGDGSCSAAEMVSSVMAITAGTMSLRLSLRMVSTASL